MFTSWHLLFLILQVFFHCLTSKCLCLKFHALQRLPYSDFFFKCIFLLSREPIDNLTPEERDARTVFCMQLAARIRPRDLEEFFSTVGKVSNKEVEVILSTWSGVSS